MPLTRFDPRQVLTARPPVFVHWRKSFIDSVTALTQGDIALAQGHFDQIDGDALKYWFHLVAQNAAPERLKVLGTAMGRTMSDSDIKTAGSKLRMPPKSVRLELLERDGWRCRYCNSPLLYKDDFLRFRELIGAPRIPMGNTNLTTHGTKFLHLATFDHVHPHGRGGESTMENVISSCYACNFGKSHFTLDDLGLDEPKENRFPPEKKWSRTVQQLRQIPSPR